MEGPPRPASLPVISGRLSLGRRRRRTKLRSCKRRQARCCSSSCSAAAQPWMTQRLQARTLFDRFPWKIHSVAGRSELFQRWNAFFSALKYCWKPPKKVHKLPSLAWKVTFGNFSDELCGRANFGHRRRRNEKRKCALLTFGVEWMDYFFPHNMLCVAGKCTLTV